MHWIVQNNLFHESGWDVLIDTLENVGISYSLHKVVPFVGEIIPEVNIPDNEDKVICIGSYAMRHLAKKNSWNPGVYDLFDCDFIEQKKHWGENLLNYDAEVKEFKDIEFTSDYHFLRPIEDTKVFPGGIFEKSEFYEWKKNVLDLDYDDGSPLQPNNLIQVCDLKSIYEEVRFWVIDSKIVTASSYKKGTIVNYLPEENVDQEFYDFVEDMIEIYEPASAFVIDVCKTDNGIKIVEINTINSAGFYNGCVQSIVFALESMES